MVNGNSLERPPEWWVKSGQDSTHSKLFANYDQLRARQSFTRDLDYRNLRLYGQHKLLGMRLSGPQEPQEMPRLSINLIQQCVDTAQARVAKNKPKPRFLTENGNYTLQRRGEKLSKFLQGIYYECNGYPLGQYAFAMGGVFGTGAVKIFREGSKIKIERAFTPEITVDEDEAMYGDCKTLYQTKFLNKYVVADMFPKYKKAILSCPSAVNEEDDFLLSPVDSDLIKVIEGWKISGNGKQGHHAICIKDCTLFEEVWAKKRVPFEFYRFRPRLLGFWGQGIGEINAGVQLELNKTLRTIQLAMHLGCVPKVFVDATSKVVKAHINNEVGGIITFSGQKPTYEQLMSVPPELFQQVKNLYQAGFQQVGLSELSATGQKPAELESGKALREYNDIENERFSIIAQDYEQFHLSIWQHILELCEEIAQEDKKFSVVALDQYGLETIIFKDIQLEKNKYVLQVFPTNLLSSTPSGKLADVSTLMDKGLLSKEDAYELLDFPDTQRFFKRKNSKMLNIYRIVEEIVDKGKYIPPTPMQDLQFGITTMQEEYLYYSNEGLESDKLELFTRWINDAGALLASVMTPPSVDPTDVSAQLGDSSAMAERESQAQGQEDILVNQEATQTQADLVPQL
jgi:hypothetical protein